MDRHKTDSNGLRFLGDLGGRHHLARAVMGRRGLLWKQIGGEKHLQWVGISAAMVCAGELGKCKEQQAYLCKGGG